MVMSNSCAIRNVDNEVCHAVLIGKDESKARGRRIKVDGSKKEREYKLITRE